VPNSPQLSALTLDQNYPECCAIDLDFHVAETLGKPIKLPEAIETLCAEHWANSEEVEPNLLALFALMTDSTYEQVHRDNTYNSENDLSSFLVFTVYAPIGCRDWVWERDVFVAVEMGAGGDPRYCGYSGAQIYRLEDDTLGDCNFLETTLGWWLEPIRDTYNPQPIDWLNDRISCGYSSSPYYELESNTYAKPIWSESRGCYLVRPKDSPYVCRAMPQEPCYG
jgi:hypothetical protein